MLPHMKNKPKKQSLLDRFYLPIEIETVPTHSDGTRLVLSPPKKPRDPLLSAHKGVAAGGAMWWTRHMEVHGRLPRTACKRLQRRVYSSLHQVGYDPGSLVGSRWYTDVRFDVNGSHMALASNDGHLEIHNFVKFIDDLSFYQNNLQEKLERHEQENLSGLEITAHINDAQMPFGGAANNPLANGVPVAAPILSIKSGQTLSCVQWSPTSANDIFCSFSSSRNVYSYDLTVCRDRPSRVFESKSGSGIFDLALNRARRQMIGMGRDCSIQFWDLRSKGTKPHSVRPSLAQRQPGPAHSKGAGHNTLARAMMAISSSRAAAAAAAGGAAGVGGFGQHNSSHTSTVTPPSKVLAPAAIRSKGAFNSLLVREDGDVVYVGSDRGYINIWDLRYASSAVCSIDLGYVLGRANAGPRDATSGISSLILDPMNHDRLAFQLYNSLLGVVDVSGKEGEVVALYRPQKVPVAAPAYAPAPPRLSFTPTGYFLCTGSWDGEKGGLAVVDMDAAKVVRPEEKPVEVIDLLENDNGRSCAAPIVSRLCLPTDSTENNDQMKEPIVVRMDTGRPVTAVACHPMMPFVVAGLQGNGLCIASHK